MQLCCDGIEADRRRIGLERGLDQREPLFAAFFSRQDLEQCVPGHPIGGLICDHLLQRCDRGFGLALLRLDLSQHHPETPALFALLLFVPDERGVRLLDRRARFFTALFGEQGRNARQPRLGAVGVETLGLGERLERALQIAEVQLCLGACDQRVCVVLRVRRDGDQRFVREARIAEQQRHPGQREPQVVALWEASHRFFEEPAGARCVARHDPELGDLERGFGCVGESLPQLVDRSESRPSIVAPEGLP